VGAAHEGTAVDGEEAGGGTVRLDGGEGWGGESTLCATRDKGVVSLGHEFIPRGLGQSRREVDASLRLAFLVNRIYGEVNSGKPKKAQEGTACDRSGSCRGGAPS
jgi:hypothetical protein